MVVRVPELIAHVVGNGNVYPGPHNISQERTSKGLQKLDSKRQLTLIWDAAVNRLREVLISGASVSIPNFGTFSFEPQWHEQKVGPDYVAKVPRFCPSDKLKTALPGYHGKEDIRMDNGAISVRSAVPNRVMFLNEVPIASGCYYKVDVVKSAIKALFQGILDLSERGYDVEINMGLCVFETRNRSMSVKFEHGFLEQCSVLHKPENPAKKHVPGQTAGPELLSDTWKKPEFSEAMATFIERPSSADVHATRIATGNLKLMSKDMTSC